MAKGGRPGAGGRRQTRSAAFSPARGGLHGVRRARSTEELPAKAGALNDGPPRRGACFLGQADQELAAIHQFEEHVKGNPTFLAGFNVAQVDRIDAQTMPEQNNSYRAFQMNCSTGRAM